MTTNFGPWVGTLCASMLVAILPAVRSVPAQPPQSSRGKGADNAPKGPSAAEQRAVKTIQRLGGWVKTDKDGHVVRVNMVFHNGKAKKRLRNHNESPEVLKVVSQFPRLKALMLHRGQATDDGLKYLQSLKHVEEIYLWEPDKVTDAGIAHLKPLKSLRYLHVSNRQFGTGLTDKSLEHLGTMKGLTGLSLQGHRFTDEGLKHVSKLTRLTALAIGLGRNKITDRGVAYIVGLKSLRTLGLQETAITDEALEEIEFAKLTNLKHLWVRQTDVTQGGVAELKEALPDLDVDYDKSR